MPPTTCSPPTRSSTSSRRSGGSSSRAATRSPRSSRHRRRRDDHAASCASCRRRPGFVMEHEETQRGDQDRGGPSPVAVRGARRPHHRGRRLLQRRLGRRAPRPPRGRSPDAAAMRRRHEHRRPAARRPLSVLEAVARAGAAHRRRAAEIERGRRVPATCSTSCVAAGCFRCSAADQSRRASAPTCRARCGSSRRSPGPTPRSAGR